jgi:hypothetical protein
VAPSLPKDGEALPTAAAKRRAIRQLPYLRHHEFAVRRRDSGLNQDYLYVRRPAAGAPSYRADTPTAMATSAPHDGRMDIRIALHGHRT